MALIHIKEDEIKEGKKRSNLLSGMFTSSDNKSHIMITVKQEKALEPDIKVHMALLPSTCLVHKRLIHFVSGFRNYAAKILLKEMNLGEFKQPDGNVSISCFPFVMDNFDILDIFLTCWNEEVMNQKGMKTEIERQNIDSLMRRADE